jgi:hypothetical protein
LPPSPPGTFPPVTMEPTPEPPRDLRSLLATLYAGVDRLTRDEIRRRAIAADLPAAQLTHVDALPGGEYTEDELLEALRDIDVLHRSGF